MILIVSHYIVFVAAFISALIALIFIPRHTKAIGDPIGSFPKSRYLRNEFSLKETGKPDECFVKGQYPDLNSKNILLKYCLKKDVLIGCLIICSIVWFLQMIVSGICFITLNENAVKGIGLYMFAVGFFDFCLAIASVIAATNTLITVLKTELNVIRYNPIGNHYDTFYECYKDDKVKKLITKDEAIEIVKKLQVSMKASHLQKQKENE